MSNSRNSAESCQYGTDGSEARLFPFAAAVIGRKPCPHPEAQADDAGAKGLATCSSCLRQAAPENDPAHPLSTVADILVH
jgi:hypothetical protein